MEKLQKKRSEIEDKYKWDLTYIYSSDDSWYDDFNNISKIVPSIRNYQGKIVSSADNLLSYIEFSNDLERKYFLNNDIKSKKDYQKIIILIFSILIVVYTYFLKDSFDGLQNLKSTDSKKKKELTSLSFMGSLLIAVSGFIFLYIAIVDDDIDVEIAFN